MTTRVTLRTIAALVGLALAAAGAVVIIESVVALADQPGWLVDRTRWLEELRGERWSDVAAQRTAIVLVAAGALLATLAAWPQRRRRRSSLDIEAPGAHHWHVPSSQVRRALQAAALRVDGVRRARVKLRAGVLADVQTNRQVATDLGGAVSEELQAEWRRLGLEQPIDPTVRVHSTR